MGMVDLLVAMCGHTLAWGFSGRHACGKQALLKYVKAILVLQVLAFCFSTLYRLFQFNRALSLVSTALASMQRCADLYFTMASPFPDSSDWEYFRLGVMW